MAPDGLASAPHPPANRGGAVGDAAAASSEPPGLRRPEASHPPAGRPEPRAAPSALPIAGAGGERPALRDGSPAPGRLPQMAVGRGRRRRADHRACGAGTIHCAASQEDHAVGPVPLPRVAGPGWTIQLAEDQMVACHGVGETLPSVSLSLPSPSFSPPTFLPRSRAGVVPRAQPRWTGGPAPESAAVRAHAREAGSASPSAATSPVPPVSPRQFLVPLPATRVAGKPGPACWRCGDLGHFIDRCPVMEVGTLVRVLDAPQAAPDQAGGTRYL